jgi:peptidoglycan/LPS O-acetylase OafA/YrhL
MQVDSTLNSRSFRPDVQGLRAIAVLLVLLFHFETRIKGGYLGVDMFFVISGFVIASSTLREIDRTQTFSWRKFLQRRVRRLLPGVAFVSLVVTAASVILLSPFGPQQTTSQMLVGAATYSSNFLLMSRNYFSLDPKSNPLMHFWSLAVEEQFYLLWPLVVGALLYMRRRAGKTVSTISVWLVVAVVIYVTSRLFVWLSVEGPTINDYSWFRPLITRNVSPERLAFYSPLTRAWEFVAGVAVALALRWTWMRRNQILNTFVWVFGAILVVIAVRWATITPGYDHGTETATNSSATLLAVIGTTLLLLGGEAAQSLPKLLTWKPLRNIGDWSYSVYLWHWPVWVLLITTFNRNLQVTTAAFGLSLLLGWVQFRWIENPIREGVRIPQFNFGSLIGSFLAVALLMYGLMSFVTPEIGKRIAGRKPDEISLHITEETCETTKFSLGVASSCIYGTESNQGSLVLVGDSLARSLSDGFVKAANEEGKNALVFSYPGCGFLIFDSPFTPTAECIQWRTDVLSALEQTQPALVMISNLSSLYVSDPLANFDLDGTRAAWGYELGRTLELLGQMQLRVVMVQPPPLFSNDLRYDISLLRPNGIQEDRIEVVGRRSAINEVEYKTALGFAHVQSVLSLDDLFCNDKSCTQKMGKLYLLEDLNHLSVDGSLLTAPLLRAEIAAALNR